MKDKKQESENSTPSSLEELNFTPEASVLKFPTLTPGEFQGLVVRAEDGVSVAYLAMELPEGPACALHLSIPKEHRTKDTIMYLRTVFFRDVHPWIKARGKEYVLVNCDYDDTKTKELFKTFGFSPSAIWIGSMPV